jgi:glycosyltransferase involved in cell wall biosynthesis
VKALGKLSQMSNRQTSGNTLTASVIIPALNEERVIGQCLDSLARQNCPEDAFEVILVDNGSTDRTIEIARTFERSLTLTVLRKHEAYISAVRNFGASRARGEYIAFLDADCIATRGWLNGAVDLLRADDSAVIGAHYTIPAGSSWVAKAWYQDLSTLKRGAVSYLPGGDLLVSRKVFFRVGGFDETIETNEDSEFCHRASAAGLRILAVPSLSVVHLGTPQTVSAFYSKQRWHGTHVRTVFLRDILHSRNTKAILFASYALTCLIATAVGLPVALVSANPAALLVGPLFLLLGSFLLAVRAAAQRNKWVLLFSLTPLYVVYGVARALCLMNVRVPRTTQHAATAVSPETSSPAIAQSNAPQAPVS